MDSASICTDVDRVGLKNSSVLLYDYLVRNGDLGDGGWRRQNSSVVGGEV
jgi:hypothetical protein